MNKLHKKKLTTFKKCCSKHILEVVLLVFFLGIIVIFKDFLHEIFLQLLINPIFSNFQKQNIWIGIWVFILSIGVFYHLYGKVKDEISLPQKRYLIEGSLFVFYLVYRLYYGTDNQTDQIVFLSTFQDCWFSYMDEIWLCVFVFEVKILKHHCHNKSKLKKGQPSNELYPFLTDTPTLKDDFERKEYAEVLISKIFATYSKNRKLPVDKKSAFVINISENYGYGKSSFFLLLKEQAKKSMEDKSLILFEFKPWLCDTPQKIIGEFFKLLSENLSRYIPGINKMLNNYVGLLLEYYSSKNVFPYLINHHLKEQPSLLKESELLKKSVHQLNRPVVILIDDVDRLHDDELMVLLSLLRNTADFPNMYYIMAADVEYVKQVLKSKNIEDPDSYLKKFINVEFLLPGYDKDKMENIFVEMLEGVLVKYHKESAQEVKKSIEIISKKKKWSQVFTNIRDMKRFLNVYSLAIDFYINNNNNNKSRPDFKLTDDIDLADLFAIELVKYLSEPIYRALRDRDDLILYLTSDPNSKGSKHYYLKEDYKSIVSEINKDEKLSESVNRILSRRNTDTTTSNSNPPSLVDKKEISTDLEELTANNRTKSDKYINYLLDYLFNKDLSNLIGASLYFKDAYFRYFTYRFKNNQMSVNEVSNMILKYNIDTYQQELKTVFEEKKQDSFIHRVRWDIVNNNQTPDIDIVEKLFLFVDEAREKYVHGFPEIDISEAQKEENICNDHNIFSILFYWFNKENYSQETIIDELKRNLSAFIAKDKHLNLLFLFLKDIQNSNSSERLIFTPSDLHNWYSLLLDRFFREDPSNQGIKEDLKIALAQSMNIEPNNLRWLASFVLSNENHFTWNDEYIKYLFETKSDLKTYLPALESPETKDLKELLAREDIRSCKVEDHPFLEMCKNIESTY